MTVLPVVIPTGTSRARSPSVLLEPGESANVVRDGTIIGALALEDELRPESRQAVDELHALGIRVVMTTGDARQVAESVGAALGIDEVFAEVLPEDKDQAVTDLQARGLKSLSSATASTTPPPSLGPMSASPSAPAPTWPSSPPGWYSPPPTPAASSASSGYRRPATRR